MILQLKSPKHKLARGQWDAGRGSGHENSIKRRGTLYAPMETWHFRNILLCLKPFETGWAQIPLRRLEIFMGRARKGLCPSCFRGKLIRDSAVSMIENFTPSASAAAKKPPWKLDDGGQRRSNRGSGIGQPGPGFPIESWEGAWGRATNSPWFQVPELLLQSTFRPESILIQIRFPSCRV